MPRYIVERTFHDDFVIPSGPAGERLLGQIVSTNNDRQVTWLHSYVSKDGSKSFCIYEAPSPEMVRISAATVGLPVDRITEITVLNPHRYTDTKKG